ncbi:MAG: carbamoyl phosphate synthase small subunit, partial [Patescibacteria group bacterium]
LTKRLREHGVMMGAIESKVFSQKSKVVFDDFSAIDLVSQVSITRPKIYGSGRKKIIAVDCGMKENSIRHLQKFPVTIHRVPYDYDYTNERYDGIFLSNGPGDPMQCTKTIAILKKAMSVRGRKPTFGVCLGSQLMALAAGAKTYKLPYGHRGQNQPCIETDSKRCVMTSQNHGYAVNEKTLPKNWRVTFRNLNDGSVEGIAHTHLPFFSVQFHPEAAPGPTDTEEMFGEFYEMLAKNHKS